MGRIDSGGGEGGGGGGGGEKQYSFVDPSLPLLCHHCPSRKVLSREAAHKLCCRLEQVRPYQEQVLSIIKLDAAVVMV